ncbi:uncharacterized protein LOC121871293 isoform X3 [Homarus americanus]|uniref:uncharacterized protein LOC121871293 isoform X3 n=1 Tax=Homarus americanus TaxID=6706 RepID=UPI001C4679C9|nr:uncharacterized protein LOC121871293 isoform X3 [Homarus americanus]
MLKQRLASHLPNSVILHGTVEAGIRYGLTEKLGTMLYVPERSVGDSGCSSLVVATPAFSTKKVQSLSVFWNTEEKDEEVARMLGSLPGLDWRKPVFFSISPKTISSKLVSMAKNQLLGDRDVEAHIFDDSRMLVHRATKLPHYHTAFLKDSTWTLFGLRTLQR